MGARLEHEPRRQSMRKKKKPIDDLRPEYDLPQLKGGIRGKYHKFVQKTFALEQVAGFPGDKALAFADALEDEERLRKLSPSQP